MNLKAWLLMWRRRNADLRSASPLASVIYSRKAIALLFLDAPKPCWTKCIKFQGAALKSGKNFEIGAGVVNQTDPVEHDYGQRQIGNAAFKVSSHSQRINPGAFPGGLWVAYPNEYEFRHIPILFCLADYTKIVMRYQSRLPYKGLPGIQQGIDMCNRLPPA